MTDHASQQITIDRPLVNVLETVLEIDDYAKWIPDITNVEVLERDERGRALKATVLMQAFGKNISHTYEYSYEDYPHVIGWMLEEGDMTNSLDGFYKLDPIDQTSTKVTYELHIELSAPLPGFIKKKATEKIVSSALENLKKYCEQS